MFVVCRSLCVAKCVLDAGCWLLGGVNCLLCVVRKLMAVVRCLMLLCAGCWLVSVVSQLLVVGC